MKKSIFAGLALTSLLALSACTQQQQLAAGGAAVGGTVGALTTGTVGGTAIGAAAGALVGAVVGGQVAGNPGLCYWRDSQGNYIYNADGSLHTAPCP